jgi:SAM-dependent methyltransferase
MYEIINECRSCKSDSLLEIISLGRTPLADRLSTKDDLEKPELTAPLNLVFCPNCNLVQIKETVFPDILFDKNYPYFSSISPFLLKHSRENVLELIKLKKLDKKSLVIEIASNDGYLLKNFMEYDIPVLGIDPAEAPARSAQEKGVPTLITFFDQNFAVQLKDENKLADVVIANNVLAHVPDLNGFVKGIKIILKDTGTAVIECPYLVNLIENFEFDTIYHQHLCYFSVVALDKLFRKHGLFLNNIKYLSIHGGSLRLYVEKKEAVENSVKKAIKR